MGTRETHPAHGPLCRSDRARDSVQPLGRPFTRYSGGESPKRSVCRSAASHTPDAENAVAATTRELARDLPAIIGGSTSATQRIRHERHTQRDVI